MQFKHIFFAFFCLIALMMQQALAKSVMLACPAPEQLQLKKLTNGEYQVNANLNAKVTPTQMFPVLTTHCSKVTRNETAAFYGGVLDCEYSCSYDGGSDDLLFYTTNVHEMQPSLKHCEFVTGDSHECHYAENNCKLQCDTAA